MASIKKLLCPIDCSDGSRVALDYASFLATHFSAELHAVHAWHVSHHVRPDLYVWMEAHGQQPISTVVAAAAKAEAEAFLTSVAAAGREKIILHVLEGEPAHTITDFATRESFDLIVLGTHGRTGVARLALGSVAEKVVRHSHCPVLTVPIRKRH